MPWLFVVFLSLGCLFTRAEDPALVRIGEVWRYQKGTSDLPFPAWTQLEFNDSAWFSGPGGFSGLSGIEATVLRDFGQGYTTVYFRKQFEVVDPESIHWLILRADFEDAMVVYLNGQEVFRQGVPGEPGEPVPAATLGEPRSRGRTEEINLTHAIPLLQPGPNLLAVQLLAAPNSFTIGLIPELLANFQRGPFLQSTTTNSTLIVWKTPLHADGFVDYGLDTNAPTRVPSSLAATNHVAALAGLLPDTDYYYRVGALHEGAEVVSDWFRFRTFKMTGPISFLALGDSGAGGTPQYAIAREMLESGGDLIMHLGDMIYPSFSHSAADARCLSVYGEQLRTTPMFIALGNHDFYGDKTALLDTFCLPTNNLSGVEHYYSFDHGDVHFTVLWTDLQMKSDYSVGSPQYQWLTNDLASTTRPWKFLFFHHTIRTSSAHATDDYDANLVRDSIQLQETIGDAASKYGVQILFNGHDHCYEKCAPVAGPIGFTSGGGGAVPYGFGTIQNASVYFHSRHHFLRVAGDENEMRVEAIGVDGSLFDVTHVRRSLPSPGSRVAEWHTPLIETRAANSGDGNINGQVLDFLGSPVGGSFGQFSSPGRLFVNHDGTNIYFGLDEVMLQPGQELLLFIEFPGVEGVPSMQSLGNGVADPYGQGVDGLDFLENLAFTNFTPSVAAILGDEYADLPARSFKRTGLDLETGTGAYFLRADLPTVPGQSLQQFHRSPQDLPYFGEVNANIVEMALPIRELPGFDPEGTLRVAAIVALTSIDSTNQTRQLDSGAIAARFEFNGFNALLQGLEFSFAPSTDHDSDGLSEPAELLYQTDPHDPDTDHDDLLDGWEVRYQLNPLSTEAESGPIGDPDADGFPNQLEFRAGTDPRDPASLLKIAARPAQGSTITVTWPAVPGRFYLLEVKEGLSGEFEPIADAAFPRQATGTTETYLLPASRETPLYLRVKLIP